MHGHIVLNPHQQVNALDGKYAKQFFNENFSNEASATSDEHHWSLVKIANEVITICKISISLY